MPKYLALDVGVSQVRYLLAEIAHKQIQVLGYGALDLLEQGAEEPAPADESSTLDRGSKTERPLKSDDQRAVLAERLTAELTKVGAAGARAIAAVARADVEIRRLNLPPASDDELAELVAVQVLSDLGGTGDEWVVDFVPQPSLPDGGRPVEAVMATEKMVQAYQAFSNRSGVKLRRLVMRPYAAASILRYFQEQGKSEFLASETTLLVERIGAEVDLIAIQDGQVLLWRTIQLDEQPDDLSAADRLTSEIVRTVAIAPAHLPAERALERIQLLGSEAEHARLAAELAEQTSFAVEILDPASLDEVSAETPADTGSRDPGDGDLGDGDLGDGDLGDGALGDGAAPLLAMLLAEATATAPAIDLLNPRKPPQPRNHKRVALLATLAAVVLCYLAGTWLQQMHAELDHANAAETSKLLELRKKGKKLVPQLALARSIAGWESAGIVWLDELRDLTGKFPSAEDVTVRAMTISSLRGGGAMIRVTGQVRDPAVIVKMDRDLRDQDRNATSTNFREQGTKGEPSWRFETVITTRRRSADDYLAMNGSAQPAQPKQAVFDTGPALDQGPEPDSSRATETAPSDLPADSTGGSVAVKGTGP